MLTTKTICALLLGGAIGVGGTVAVQKTRPPVVKHQSKKVSQRAPQHKAKPPAFRSLPSKGPALLDCPVIGSPFSVEPNAIALPSIPPPVLGSGTSVAWPGVWGGGGFAPVAPPPNLPAVPEPDAWALWIGGFGLVGLSMRRRRHGKA